MGGETDVTVLIPVSERLDDVETLHDAYKIAVSNVVSSYEFLYVLDGHFPEAAEKLVALQESGEAVNIIQLTRSFGEATALTAGFDAAKGQYILTLPAYFQVEPSDISLLLGALEDSDVAVAVRTSENEPKIKKLQRRVFNWLVSTLTGMTFRDLGCGARAFRRVVIDEVRSYGDQHRFFPLLALRAGFRVSEVDVASSQQDTAPKYYKLGVYVRRALDILTVFFLVKFTQKPLRFFGLVGSAIATIGVAVTGYVVVQRLLGYAALAERPALLLGSLFIVLGIQLFAIGLIGELLIFTRSKKIKEYRIDRTINL